jgi:Na+/H+ antiporter NhaC
MRIFEALNEQHMVMYLFPALVFILIFAAGLGFFYIRHRDSEERQSRIVESFAEKIEGRNAPFPLALALIIAGTVVWCLLYILYTATLKVKI